MKGLKKLLTVILTLAMVMTMGMTAFAAESNEETGKGTITIDNAKVGQTYKIYRIFDYTPTTDDDYSKGVNTLNSAWSNFSAAEYFTKDSNGYITSKLNESNVAAFATLAGEYAADTEHIISPVEYQNAKTNTVTFSKLPLGYYLLDSSLGTVFSLDTTQPTITLKEKNDVPSIDKKVQEDSDAEGDFGATNDAEIGQTVTYQSTISMKNGAEDYVMHDSMSTGLTYNAVQSVFAGTTPLILDRDYKVDPNPTDKDSFDLKFTDSYLKSVRDAGKDVTIVVTYTAILNSSAVIATSGKLNTVKLEYNNNVIAEGPSTTTYKYSLNLFKYAKENPNKALAGAYFKLYRDAGYTYDATQTTAVNEANNTGRLVSFVINPNDGSYRLATTDDVKKGLTVDEIITTDDSRGINIEGLDTDKYHMIETQAPAGYNLLTSDILIEVQRIEDARGTVQISSTISGKKTEGPQIKVENGTGALLPHTGGIGTTIFYLIGGIMILGAFVTFIVRRKMSANK